MTLTARQAIDYAFWALTVFLLASFQILEQFSWGRYSFIICSCLLLFLSGLRNNGRVVIKIEAFHILVLAFAVYVLLNSLWSQEHSESLEMVRTLFRILFCFSLLYWAFMGMPNSEKNLIQAFVAASYVLAVYSLFYFGVQNILSATRSVRLNNEFANVNGIAVFLSMAIICEVYLLLQDGFRFYRLLSLLSVLIIAATQARKAIVILVFGVLALLILHNIRHRSFLNTVLRIAFIFISFVIVVYLVSNFTVFSGANHRLDLWFNSFTGSGKADRSSILRSRLASLGLTWWLKYPIGGVGMSTTHLLSREYLHVDWYLHNNYVELLCGGGILAFLTYYSMHAYLLRGIFKLRKSHYPVFIIAVVWLGLILLTDFSRVSYYSKTVFFELMMLFVIMKKTTESEEEAIGIE